MQPFDINRRNAENNIEAHEIGFAAVFTGWFRKHKHLSSSLCIPIVSFSLLIIRKSGRALDK